MKRAILRIKLIESRHHQIVALKTWDSLNNRWISIVKLIDLPNFNNNVMAPMFINLKHDVVDSDDRFVEQVILDTKVFCLCRDYFTILVHVCQVRKEVRLNKDEYHEINCVSHPSWFLFEFTKSAI